MKNEMDLPLGERIAAYVAFAAVGVLVLFVVIYFPILAAQNDKQETQAPRVTFTQRAGGDLAPWCVATQYSAAYLAQDGQQGPWSAFSPEVQSLTETFPLVRIARPGNPEWRVLVRRRVLGVDEQLDPDLELDPTGTAVQFVDMDNPCELVYIPRPSHAPRPLPDYPLTDNGVSWLQPAASRPWCVATRYRAVFSAQGVVGEWSSFSPSLWQSAQFTVPVFYVASPPAGLSCYWAPNNIEFEEGAVLSFSLNIVGSLPQHTEILLPPELRVTTPERLAQWVRAAAASSPYAPRIDLAMVYQADSDASVATLFYRSSPGNGNATVLVTPNSSLPQNVLYRLGFRLQSIAASAPFPVRAELPVPWKYTSANVAQSPELLVTNPNMVEDHMNLCEVDAPTQPPAPTAGPFTVELA